jgi:hypothetical protein
MPSPLYSEINLRAFSNEEVDSVTEIKIPKAIKPGESVTF